MILSNRKPKKSVDINKSLYKNQLHFYVAIVVGKHNLKNNIISFRNKKMQDMYGKILQKMCNTSMEKFNASIVIHKKPKQI